MVRFKICDTDVKFLEQLANMLHQLYTPCTVEYMYGPDVLEVSLRSSSGDAEVLLTEIDLRNRKSFDIIRRWQKDIDSTQIIYITSHMEYCTAVYDTRHSGFLVKPIHPKELKHAVDRALDELRKQKHRGLQVRQGRNVHVISFSDLHRVESHGRLLRLITEKEQVEIYGKLENLLEQMDQRFLRCHQSHLINMDYVSRYTGDSFLMKGDISIPISQSKRREARERFLDYLGIESAKVF